WWGRWGARRVSRGGRVGGDVAAGGGTGAAAAPRLFRGPADRGSLIGAPGTDLVWAGGRLVDAWPRTPDENEYTQVRDSSVPTLLIGGNLDFAAPPQWGTRELLPHLSNGREVILRDLGHSDDFWAYEPDAAKRLVNTYLGSGRVDASLYIRNRLDFTPAASMSDIAKITRGSMLGLAGLAVLSLLWMAVRVRRCGSFGRKASAAMRSVYVVVLGFGGLFLGALVALTALPGTPVNDELLVSLSVGVPIGLAVYLAWVNRDWSRRTKTIGFAGAAGGALIGAWLGFNVTTAAFGMAGPVLGVLGAILGANAAVLGLDIAWDRQASDRFPSYSRRRRESSPATTPDPTSRRRPGDEPVVASTVLSHEGGTMSRARQNSNIAARMGRWTAGHWKTATLGWLALVLLAFAFGNMGVTQKIDPNAEAT